MENNDVGEDSDVDPPIKQDLDPVLQDLMAVKMDTHNERDGGRLNQQHIGDFRWLDNFFRTDLIC